MQRIYRSAQTPFAWVCTASVLSDDVRARMDGIIEARDPVRLLDQIGQVPAARWSRAAVRDGASHNPDPLAPVRCVADAGGERETQPQTEADAPLLRNQKRANRRTKTALPRWWRTRLDPLATVWAELEQWREAAPTRTATSLFDEL